MKPIFDEQAVRELGYQKYTPGKKDWIIGIVIALSILIITALLYLGLMHGEPFSGV